MLPSARGTAVAATPGDLVGGKPLRSRRVELSTELVVRESTAPVV
jgi:hypothetical protein